MRQGAKFETTKIEIGGDKVKSDKVQRYQVQSNRCTTTTLGTPNLWPLLTVGRLSEVALCYKNLKWNLKIVVCLNK